MRRSRNKAYPENREPSNSLRLGKRGKKQFAFYTAAVLRACCAAYPDSILKDSPSADTRHGFRIDTGRYSYMLVCSFRSADCGCG